MKRFIPIAALALSVCAGLAMADTQATAGINMVSVAGCNGGLLPGVSCVTDWTNVGPAMTIKMSNSTSLFVDTALVTGLYTSTQVKGNSTGATSSARAATDATPNRTRDAFRSYLENVIVDPFGGVGPVLKPQAP